MYIIYIILIIYIIYNVYNLSISLVQRSKNSSSTEQTHVCYDLIVSCQLLVVRIAPAQGCLVGAHRHVLRPYCQLLVVSCQDRANAQACLVGANRHVLRPYCQLLVVSCQDFVRTGLPRRGEQTCVTTLLLVVSCQLLGLRPHRVASSGEQTCVTTLLLVVSCQLLGLRPPRRAKCPPLLKEKMFHGGLRINHNRRPFALQSTHDSISIVGFDVSRCVTAGFDHAGYASDRPLP